MDDGTELFFNVKDCIGSKPAAGDILKFDMADSVMKPGNKEALRDKGMVTKFQHNTQQKYAKLSNNNSR